MYRSKDTILLPVKGDTPWPFCHYDPHGRIEFGIYPDTGDCADIEGTGY